MVTLSQYLPKFCNHLLSPSWELLKKKKKEQTPKKLTFWFPYSRKLLTKATSYHKKIKQTKVMLLNWCSLVVLNRIHMYSSEAIHKKRFVYSVKQNKTKQKQQPALHNIKKKVYWMNTDPIILKTGCNFLLDFCQACKHIYTTYSAAFSSLPHLKNSTYSKAIFLNGKTWQNLFSSYL